MKLNIKVIPGARQNAFKEEAGGIRVYLTTPPIEGRANQALVKFLAGHFGVNASRIEIIKGLKSRNKVVNVSSI
ncbi:MAG: DUF167 domain-containing protein [Candidatus Omnitrophica bacterium]|nr:DUF167 domain-containing protein [Candidatus Omnitrophota bacterium]